MLYPFSMKLVTVAAYSEAIEAELARNTLDAAGIEAFLADENLVSMVAPYQIALGGIKVQVRDAEARTARAALAESEAEPIDDRSSLAAKRPPACSALRASSSPQHVELLRDVERARRWTTAEHGRVAVVHAVVAMRAGRDRVAELRRARVALFKSFCCWTCPSVKNRQIVSDAPTIVNIIKIFNCFKLIPNQL